MMKQQTLNAFHVTPQRPGASILQAPGLSSAPDPWHINKMDSTMAKRTRREREANYVIGEMESRRALETLDASDEERQADLQEEIKKRSRRYEELPGTPQRFAMFLKMQDVARWRNVDCVHYNDCLGYAAFRNWPSFICTGCKHAADLR
jgi:hypothetical protein